MVAVLDTPPLFILCGGNGTRIKSLLGDIPKILAPINGIPFIDYLLSFAKLAKVKHLVFLTGFRSEQIEAYLKEKKIDFSFDIIKEETPLGTGGAIVSALHRIQPSLENFFLLNGDTFPVFNVTRFQSFKKNCSKILVTQKIDEESRYGTITFNEDFSVKSFQEKNVIGHGSLTNAGFLFLAAPFFKKQRQGTYLSLEEDLLPRFIKEEGLYCYVTENGFFDFGVPEAFERAHVEIPKMVNVNQQLNQL